MNDTTQINQDGGNPGDEAAAPDAASPPGPPLGEGSDDAGLQNPGALPATEYRVILSYKCAACGDHCGLADPRALMAAMQGMTLTMRCPKCNAAQRLEPPKREESRIIKPGVQFNRHARRAMVAAQRGLLR